MKSIKDTPRADEKPTHKVVFNQVQNEIVMQEEEAVAYCEKEYPETCKEFKNKNSIKGQLKLIYKDYEINYDKLNLI